MTTQESGSFLVNNVHFEHHLPNDALGIGEARPRISWRISNTPTGFFQERYQIQFYRQKDQVSQSPLHSADVNSEQSNLVPWPLENPLQSREGLFARVRVWGKEIAEPSNWSELAYVEAGLLLRSDWKCRRIAAPWKQDSSIPRPEELYRKQFVVKTSGKISRARLYITAQGIYEAEINGHKVGDHFLAPGWSSYSHRLIYQVYDVLDLLSAKDIENCFGVRVGEGWFCGRIGFEGGKRNIWGDHTSFMAQLEIEYADGSSDLICSDASWEVTSGPIRLAEIYHGEKYDSSHEVLGWSTTTLKPGEPDTAWSLATAVDLPPTSTAILAMSGAPIRRLHTIQPVEIITTPKKKLVLDFGQNLVGYTRIKHVKGQKGDAISLFHAEVLEKGECARRPLRDCDALDEYRLQGLPEGESWEPRFTFHGFRYVQIDGLSPEADPQTAFEAVVVYTEMEPAGEFSCSNKLLTKLHENVRWGMRGNFVGLPTDCPQRDERLGWTGDIALFAPTASFLYDCTGMLLSWLADLAEDQADLGGVPPVVCPNAIHGNGIFPDVFPCAIWADSTILVPWALYEATGDTSILATQYHSMRSWMDILPRNSAKDSRLYDPVIFQLGDWLDPDAPPENPAKAKTDAQLVANAFLVQSLDLVAKIATILGKAKDAEEYHKEAGVVRKEFANEYITPNGRLSSDSQAAYALAICFDLYPTAKQKQKAGERLGEIVRTNAFRIGTGFAGTPFICEALTRCGQAQVAYRMLVEEQCPSWLYPITMGATTMWERWDSMMPDGSINPGEMTSFNHYALGAVATFLHQRLGGLRRLEPGWKKSRAEPILGADFTEASVSHVTPFGEVACSWKLVDGKADSADQGEKKAPMTFEMTVRVPPNTTMEVVLPSNAAVAAADDVKTVSSGEWSFSVPYERSYKWPPKAISWRDPALE